jgi:hypothetical protein
MKNRFSSVAARGAVNSKALPSVKIPPAPRIPESFLKKFPELEAVNKGWESWEKSMNSMLAGLSTTLRLDERVDKIDKRLTELEGQ